MTKATWQIARATRDDAFACAALRLQMDLETGHPNRDGFIVEYADYFLNHFDEMPTWLAKTSDGAVVGMVQTGIIHKSPTLARPARPMLYVNSVFVTPSHRNAGIGEALLRTLDAWADGMNIERMMLNTRPKSRPLYERLGFDKPEPRHMHRDAPFASATKASTPS